MDGQEKVKQAIGQEEIRQAVTRLTKYKNCKQVLDQRIIDNEQYWKQRHWEGKSTSEDIEPTAWLFNVILNKHADMMEGYPEANMKAKERSDVAEAEKLSSIVPVILEANRFKQVYSDCCWYKLIKGTAAYGIFWDPKKHNGQGDITIQKVNILNLFWEPGIVKLEQSREVFHCVLTDNDVLEQNYPQLKGKLGGQGIDVSEFIFDDNVPTDDKSIVVDWYYKTHYNGVEKLQYCKFVGDTVLYASENDTQRPTAPVIDPNTGAQMIDEYGQPLVHDVDRSTAEKGWYEHGKFPFVLDPLFRVEGSPCGYSYADICKPAQDQIDMLSHAVVKNALLASKPRFFYRGDGTVNTEEYADFSKDFVRVDGNLDDTSIRQIDIPEMPNQCMTILENKINELRETSGNTDISNGSAPSGVTAASAIAALQESEGKTSRDNLMNTYEAYKDIIYQVIELIRQFYSNERQFRITGSDGHDQFISYSNQNIQPQDQGQMFGLDMGFRLPEFDIEVSAQKATAYSKMSQNELALQLYQAGVFNPQNSQPALALLQIMDFNHKQDVINVVNQNSMILQQLQMMGNMLIQMTSQTQPQIAQQVAMTLQQLGMPVPVMQNTQSDMPEYNEDGTMKQEEHPFVENARERTEQSTQV